MSRKIIVAAPATNKAKAVNDFSGSTWGELKNHPVLRELLVGNVEAILNPGNVTLTRDDASLPEGDFRIFLVPTQNKAGMTSDEARRLGQEITETLIKAASLASSDQVSELGRTLKEEIENFFGVDLGDDGCEECAEVLAEAKGYLR